jgi:hypothetical protein
MFFYLGNDCDLLTKQRENLFTDLGWKQQNDVYYKGYCLDYNIDNNIDKILNGDRPQGIYAVIQNNSIFYPKVRPFPLYKKDNVLTNLKLNGLVEVPVSKYKLPRGSKSLDVVVTEIIKVLVDNLSKVELNIWCTGGIDSTMLIAIAEYAELPYTIHIAKPRTFKDIKYYEGSVEEYTSPLIEFCREKYWAYGFLSNFNNKILTTGFYGDEYFCRTVWQINQLANSIGKEIVDVVKPTDYIHHHLYRYKNQLEHLTITNAKQSTIESIGNSHAWHIDNTITFCPLMDKRIVDNVWSLDVDSLLTYAVDATIQKQIISETKHDVLLLTDIYKNAPLGRKNFFENISKVKLPNCNDIVVH